MIWSLVLLSTMLIRSMSQITEAPTCNNCCQGPIGPQGPSGIPGIPGSHGTNGIPGGFGPKGEAGVGIQGGIGARGDPGVKGERGDGEKGDRGEPGAGLPGKVGPSGPQGERGVSGPQGERGVSGPQGERGVSGPQGNRGVSGPQGNRGVPGTSAVTRRSAFTAVKTVRQDGETNLVVTFQTLVTDIGNDFDTSTGKFTCRVPGVYQFMFSLNADLVARDLSIALVKNNQIQVGVTVDVPSNHGNRQDVMFGNGAIVHLLAGDQVWLKFLESSGEVDVHNSSWRQSSFSGILMYED